MRGLHRFKLSPLLLRCCVQMASALAHLHKHGVAHLDVKPDNIYLQVGPLAVARRAYCCESV